MAIRAQYLMSPYNIHEARRARLLRRRIWTTAGVIIIPLAITLLYRWLLGGH